MVKYLMYLNENKFQEEEYITVFFNYKATNSLYVHICCCKYTRTYISVIYLFLLRLSYRAIMDYFKIL
jgi:hypothetical protein